MHHYVNEYRYTPEASAESVGAWWKWKFRKTIWMLIASLVLLVPVFLLTKNDFCIYLGFLCGVLLVMFPLKRRTGIRTERKRMEVIYPDEPPLLRIEIGEKIVLKSNENTRNIHFSAIEGIGETPSFIVLFISGNMTVSLAKNGFLEGIAQECLAYLRAKSGKK